MNLSIDDLRMLALGSNRPETRAWAKEQLQVLADIAATRTLAALQEALDRRG